MSASKESPKKESSRKQAAAAGGAKQVKVTLVKSVLGHPEAHRRVVRALGLTKTNRSVLHFDTPIIRGMLNKVSHLITIEEVAS